MSKEKGGEFGKVQGEGTLVEDELNTTKEKLEKATKELENVKKGNL